MKIKLEDFIEHIVQQVQNIHLNNLQSDVDSIKKLFDVLVSLNDINILSEEVEEQTQIINNDHETNQKDPPKIIKEEIPEKVIGNSHRFVKELVGGHVEGVQDSYVNEITVRSIGLQNGNLVRYENGKLIIVDEEDNGNPVDFTLYKYCPVKKEGLMLICDETINGTPLKHGEVIFKYHITDFLRTKFNIQEGDLLDIGYDQNGWRIVWKHKIDKEAYAKTLPSSHYKGKQDKQQKSVDIDLKKKVILVIGLDAKKSEYKEAIERANGQFKFMSGNESLRRVHTACNSVNVVLLLKDYLSHPTVLSTVKHCKAKGIPFKVVDGLGVQTLLMSAEEMVNKIRM